MLAFGLSFMNTLLRHHKIIRTIFNDKFKLCKHWHSSQTKQSILSQFIHEATPLFKKMWLHNQQFQDLCYSTDASYGFRYWKKISVEKPKPQVPGLPFKIISYNILAQDLLLQHMQLYTHSSKTCLRWNYRLDRLTGKIVEQRPDIICLQEVQENHLADIMTNIKSQLPSMSCLFKKKTGPKPDGCAIIYNNKLFELVLSDAVEFYRPEIELLDRHNIALIAKFQFKSKKEANLLISTTHLLFNPKRQDVRLAQIMVLLAELDRHSIMQPGKLDRMPVILTGDFNFQADSAPFQLITTGRLCYERLEKKSLTESGQFGSQQTGKSFISEKLRITDNCQHIDCVRSNYKSVPQKLQTMDHLAKDSKLFSTGTLTHDLQLQSAYNHFDGKSYGSIFQGKWVTIDHLFYSQEDKNKPKHKKGALKLLSIYELPSVKQCKLMGSLPNRENGSDHLMLAAQFYFKFPSDNK